MQQGIAKCSKCERETETPSTIYSDEGVSFLCNYCYALPTKSPPMDSPFFSEESIIVSERVELSCANCGFEFSRNKENIESSCPYCGEGTLEEK